MLKKKSLPMVKSMLEEDTRTSARYLAPAKRTQAAGSATFRLPVTGITAHAAKAEMGRGFRRVKHEGGLNRDAEIASGLDRSNWLKQDPEKQLKWLTNIQQKSLQNRGFIPREYYVDLSEAYIHIATVYLEITSNADAKRILDELLSETQKRADEQYAERTVRLQEAKEEAARIDVAIIKGNWNKAEKALFQLKNDRDLTPSEKLDLLRVYSQIEGEDVNAVVQRYIQQIRETGKDSELLIPIAEKVVEQLKQEYDDALEYAQSKYPGLYSD